MKIFSIIIIVVGLAFVSLALELVGGPWSRERLVIFGITGGILVGSGVALMIKQAIGKK